MNDQAKLTFVYGRTGTGKTTYIMEKISGLLRDGCDVILLCPEQEAVIAERKLTERLAGQVPTERLEILNFGRLPERVSRLYGGLTEPVLESGGRRLMMHRALVTSAPLLKEYGTAAADQALLDQLLTTIASLKMCCISPAMMEEAAGALSQTKQGAGRHLADKLDDLALLYQVYEQQLHARYRDPQDVLDRLAAMLSGAAGDFFRNKHVFLDGFYGFTAQQYRIITHIFRSAASVTAALACDAGGAREWMLRRVYETEKRLFGIARDLHLKTQIHALSKNCRTDDPALLYLWENLWQLGKTEQAAVPARDSIRVFSCSDPFSEAEAVAMDIRRKILCGCRYRDITVILRDMARYEGILDTTFEKYGIPCYMAKRSHIAAKPFFAYLYALFSIFTYHYQRQDVIAFLKTGLSGISSEDAFLFENYITTWNLSGGRLYTEDAWTMHPRGYTEMVTDHDLSVLETVNRVRAQLYDILEPLYEKLRQKPPVTIREISTWLWEFLEREDMAQRIQDAAQRERVWGDLSGAEETEQLWPLFVTTLDTMVTVAGDVQCLPVDYLALYALVIEDCDIGTIPARMDEVVIGDASLLRPDNAAYVYLMGTVDGVFPKTPVDDALFSDHEMAMLAGVGLQLSDGAAEQMQDEMFHFYYAAAAAKTQLTVTYPMADLSGKAYRPSIGAERILALFPDVLPTDPMKASIMEKTVAEKPALELLAYVLEQVHSPASDTGYAAYAKALLTYFSDKAADNEALARKLAAWKQPLTVRRNRLHPKTIEMLFGKSVLSMTQSRLERYVLCHFSYFCRYVLRLEEPKRASIGSTDIGNFVHFVLEKFLSQYMADPEKEKYQNEAILHEMVSGLLGSYLHSICHVSAGQPMPQRIQYLFGRLRDSAVLLVKNLLHEMESSDFQPRDFELPVGGDDGRALPALQIISGDGTKIRIYGTIDRVDTYEKDGKTYIRVVDYKTYVKQFSLDDIASGINMQLLLYLFAVWQNGNTRYTGEIIPAGILYLAVNPTEETHAVIPTKEEADAAVEAGMVRRGLFLDDREVLEAMEHGLQGHYIPVKLKRDGNYYKGAPLETLEGFGRLMHQVEDTVRCITDAMRAGNADAIPISKTEPETGLDPCAYCQMKAICRAI